MDDPVTEGIQWLAPSSYATPNDIFALEGDNSGDAVWCGVGLNLANEMNMYFTFTAADVTDLYVKISINGRETAYSVSDMTPEADGRYRLCFHGIMAFEFSDEITASFVRAGETVGASVTYSVDSYTANMENDGNTALVDLVKAITNYGNSAKNYNFGG